MNVIMKHIRVANIIIKEVTIILLTVTQFRIGSMVDHLCLSKILSKKVQIISLRDMLLITVEPLF